MNLKLLSLSLKSYYLDVQTPFKFKAEMLKFVNFLEQSQYYNPQKKHLLPGAFFN
ncbi:hypothetical protein FHW89_001621 [Mucilaginibacter sp. SG564]|nr:hypothetical protein [Mucilaginibacter sp. SG564]